MRENAVKTGLTPKRSRPRETGEYTQFVHRAIKGLARRVGAGDVDAIEDMLAVSAELDEAILAAVAGLREAGYSWAEIGARAGVTKQAAHKRWSARCEGRARLWQSGLPSRGSGSGMSGQPGSPISRTNSGRCSRSWPRWWGVMAPAG